MTGTGSTSERKEPAERSTPRVLLRRADRQLSILEGAAVAFARTGFADTTMEDVAAATGVTKLIVYRHFDSKEQLYRAVLERVADRLSEEFVAGRDRPERRGAGVRALLAVARESPAGFVLLWRHAAREPRFADYVSDFRVVAAHATAERLGSLGDETLDAWSAEAVVSWSVDAVLAWLHHGEPARDDEFLDLVIDGVRAMRAAWSMPTSADRP